MPAKRQPSKNQNAKVESSEAGVTGRDRQPAEVGMVDPRREPEGFESPSPQTVHRASKEAQEMTQGGKAGEEDPVQPEPNAGKVQFRGRNRRTNDPKETPSRNRPGKRSR